MSNHIDERTLSEIGETYAALRIISPKADAAMARSMEIYGQLSPVVCVKTPDGLQLLDGFKRLRAARQLQHLNIQIVLLETTERACKAGMIRLNRVAQSITDLEEALILHSLYRDDGLSQVEIATLMGRDKSWVSRRISLVEDLHEEVRRHLGLGLVCVSVCRELAKLPRGNQPEVLSKVLKHRLGKRDVEELVRVLLERPKHEYSPTLDNLCEILTPARSAPAETPNTFFRQLTKLERFHQAVLKGTAKNFPPETEADVSVLRAVIVSGQGIVSRLQALLQDKPLEER